LQTNATQMAPQARGTGVSMFSAFLFIGQSIGVLLVAALSGWLGTAPVVAGSGVALCATGWVFARAIENRDQGRK
jgi:predicted MFS family arabinose efflux permease